MADLGLTGIWRDRRVLVTGGKGFLGAHLTQMLNGLGASVVEEKSM